MTAGKRSDSYFAVFIEWFRDCRPQGLRSASAYKRLGLQAGEELVLEWWAAMTNGIRGCAMDDTEARIIESYGKALQFYLAYIPSDDASWDRSIWEALKAADMEIRDRRLEGKPEYDQAVLRADKIARAIRANRL